MSLFATPAALPELDVAWLDYLLEWAEGENNKHVQGLPSEWNQAFWITHCGSACCIAGKRVLTEEGVEPIFDIRDDHGAFTEAHRVTLPDGSRDQTAQLAEDLLGLTSSEADDLFCASNDIEDLRRIVQRIKNGFYR